MSRRRFGPAGYFGRPERSLLGWVLVSFPVAVVTCVAIRLLWSDAPRLLVLVLGLFVGGVVGDLVTARRRGDP
jgi:hypothetical protein